MIWFSLLGACIICVEAQGGILSLPNDGPRFCMSYCEYALVWQWAQLLAQDYRNTWNGEGASVFIAWQLLSVHIKYTNIPMFVVFGGTVARTRILNHRGRPCMCTSCDMRSPKTTARTSVGVEVIFRMIWKSIMICAGSGFSLRPHLSPILANMSQLLIKELNWSILNDACPWVLNCESSSCQSISFKLEIIPRILPDSVPNVII